MEFKDLVFARRSIRQYTDRAVTSDELSYIMNAAINAPSACNFQSWHFYIVSDPAVKEGFKEFCADWISTAPIVVVICTSGKEMTDRWPAKAEKFITQDTALAMQNMLLAAADIGLGGCIIGAYDDDKCRALLNIPACHSPVALMPIGEPAVIPPARSRKPLSEVVTYVGEVKAHE